ncbi:MAG: coproporphyrinogen dehydrogenase HemZ [Eubacteriales bacterium]
MTEIFLKTNTPEFFNELSDEIRIFIPGATVKRVDEITGGLLVCAEIEETDITFNAHSALFVDSIISKTFNHGTKKEPGGAIFNKRQKKHTLKICVFRLLKEYFKISPPWGSLTGIRPTKFFRDISSVKGKAFAKNAFLNDYDVREDKVRLTQDTINSQKNILESIKENDIDVYVGIPFCPSRCAYCSFASNDIKKFSKYVDDYIEKLIIEINSMKDINAAVRSIYIGGGTPSALDEKHFSALLDALLNVFTPNMEFCVEAGRPDSITREKLKLMKDANVLRISINPQTLNELTLAKIGRAHTIKQFFDSYELAKGMGFDNINVDIIVGLPGETESDIIKTLDGIMKLNPENLTVHTLAIKRASKFNLSGEYSFTDGSIVENMVNVCQKKAYENGFKPYYLYRQKHMMGNLENVGFSKDGKECVYNIDIMEEAVSIIAFGAGAISKRVFDKGNRIERAVNVSDLKNYLERTDEMIERKRDLFKCLL